jgi:signal transduction histidine kinase
MGTVYRRAARWPTSWHYALGWTRVVDWLSRQWRGFTESYDRREVLAGSHPLTAGVAVCGMLIVFGLLGYVPAIAASSRFERPWLSMVFALLGGALTTVVWRAGAEGIVGNVATLFDSAFYGAALVLAACSTSTSFGMGLAIVYGFAAIGFWGRTYALTAPFAIVTALPVVIVIPLARPGEAVVTVLVCSYFMMLVAAAWSARRRELLAAHDKLTQAVGATSRVADDSVQAALSATLLSLGNFLHELRNHQAAVRSNLTFIDMQVKLDGSAREALADALAAQDSEERLVRDTVESLKSRARTSLDTFLLDDVLAQASDGAVLGVSLMLLGRPFAIAGSADDLQGVLQNLIRNAVQAGAKEIHVEARLEPSGEAARITVHDDGPGIDEEHWDKLFIPFAYTTKSSGTGLGLYLCRRYVELFGGAITVGRGRLGGASFDIHLPGHARDDDAPPAS